MVRKRQDGVRVNERLAKLCLQAGEPLQERELNSLGAAVIQARARRTTPPHVFIDPKKAGAHDLHCLGLERETCLQVPLRVNRVEMNHGGTVFVESRNGVHVAPSNCLLSAVAKV